MTLATRIPATILTGFLGAGKTTLIRSLLADAGGRRIALIVNEFGEVGFDAALLSECGAPGCGAGEIVELTNGCICCTVADDFLPAMEQIIARDPAPDHIIIETSGLALPQPLIRAFLWPEVRHRITVDAVVVVADGLAIAEGRIVPEPPEEIAGAIEAGHDDSIEELFHDQLRSADLVVLTKTDLLDPAAAGEVRQRLRRAARPETEIVTAHDAMRPAAVLLGIGAASEDDLAQRWSQHEREGEEHEHDDFANVIAVPSEFGSLDEVRSRIGAALALPGVLRIKGSVRVADKAILALVQGVGRRVETWFGTERGAAELVVIGKSGFDRMAVRRALGA